MEQIGEHQSGVLQAQGSSKAQQYQLLSAQLSSVFENESDFIANMANCAALIYHSLVDLNWAGFYILRENALMLGPFQGKPACVRIPLGKGVCGTAAQRRETILVEDVHQFPGHIACDSASQSEIVIPIVKAGQVVGVLDLDSPILNRFDAEDAAGLERLVSLFMQLTDIPTG